VEIKGIEGAKKAMKRKQNETNGKDPIFRE
jgi:hypothetical protein